MIDDTTWVSDGCYTSGCGKRLDFIYQSQLVPGKKAVHKFELYKNQVAEQETTPLSPFGTAAII